MKYFRDELAQWIGERGLKEAATALGVAASTVHYWRNGRYVPPETKIAHVASVLGLSQGRIRRAISAQRCAAPASTAKRGAK